MPEQWVNRSLYASIHSKRLLCKSYAICDHAKALQYECIFPAELAFSSYGVIVCYLTLQKLAYFVYFDCFPVL